VHTWRVLLPLVTLGTAQFFDLGTFLVMIGLHGPGAELNPVVSAMFLGYGTPMVAFAKLALFVLVAATAIVVSRAGPSGRSRLSGLMVGSGIVAGLIGGLSNALLVL
jgi:hypothetical protein